MSHWIKVATKMDNLDHILSALDRLKQPYEHQAGNKLSVSASGRTSQVDVRLTKDLGITQQEDGTFAFEGDFYYTKLNQTKFTHELQGQYCVIIHDQYRCEPIDQLLIYILYQI